MYNSNVTEIFALNCMPWFIWTQYLPNSCFTVVVCTVSSNGLRTKFCFKFTWVLCWSNIYLRTCIHILLVVNPWYRCLMLSIEFTVILPLRPATLPLRPAILPLRPAILLLRLAILPLRPAILPLRPVILLPMASWLIILLLDSALHKMLRQNLHRTFTLW